MFLESKKGIYIGVNRVAQSSIIEALSYYENEESLAKVTYEGALSKYGKSAMNRNFVFSFVRNPFDRFVSLFFSLVGDNRRLLEKYKINTFERFVVEVTDNKIGELFDICVPQTSVIKPAFDKEDGGPDYTGRYETLQRDFDTVCDTLLIPNMKLDVTNKSKRFNYQHYFYKKELVDKVRKFYEEDFDTFRYTF